MRILSRTAFIVLGAISLFGCTDKKAKENPDPETFSAVSHDSAKEIVDSKFDSIPLNPPVDEWESSASLFAFRTKLLEDLQNGNQAEILAAFSETIDFSPRAELGPAGLVTIYELDGSKEKLAPLKVFLDTLLKSGGCSSQFPGDTSFTAPSFHCISKSVRDRWHGMDFGVVTKGGAALLKSRQLNGGIQANLQEYEIVTISEYFPPDSLHGGFHKITRANGEIGYVAELLLKTKFDGFLRVQKGQKGWRIQGLFGPGIEDNDV